MSNRFIYSTCDITSGNKHPLWGLGFKIINVFANVIGRKVANPFLTFLEGWETSFFAFGAHFFKIPTMSKFQYFLANVKKGTC
jgi:hypothetical protein